LKLRNAFNLNKAHTAGANRATKLWLVTKDGDFNVAAGCCVNKHRAINSLNVSAVDCEGDDVFFGAGQGVT
jgi:hypothetical protein